MQNLVSLNLSAQDLADIDAALATLRRVFAPMVALQPDQRRELYKMGDKSEAFCRQTLSVLAANPQRRRFLAKRKPGIAAQRRLQAPLALNRPATRQPRRWSLAERRCASIRASTSPRLRRL